MSFACAALAAMLAAFAGCGMQDGQRSTPPGVATPKPVHWRERVEAALETADRIALSPPDPRFQQALDQITRWLNPAPDEPNSKRPGLVDRLEWEPLRDSDHSDGHWLLKDKSGTTISKVSQFPTFHQMHLRLQEHARRLISDLPGGTLPERPLATEALALLDQAYAEPSYQLLALLSRAPLPYSGPEAKAIARALVSIALETYDPMELLGPFEACAWAACAIAETTGAHPGASAGHAPSQETVLLAESLGYAPEAIALAARLESPGEAVARAKIERRPDALARLARERDSLTPWERGLMLFAKEQTPNIDLPAQALPHDGEPGGRTALLASAVRSTRGNGQIDAAARLFSLELQTLQSGTGKSSQKAAHPQSNETATEVDNLIDLLNSGRSGGGLSGRYVRAENNSTTSIAPLLPGDTLLHPRRAVAFGSLYLIGLSLGNERDLSNQFDLVLGNPPADTPVGLLCRVVRSLTVKRGRGQPDDGGLWRRFEEYLETGGLPRVLFQPEGIDGADSGRMVVLQPSRPRNRAEIRQFLAQPVVRQTARSMALLTAQAVDPGIDNVPQEVARLLLQGEDAAAFSASHPAQLDATVRFLGEMMDQDMIHPADVAHWLNQIGDLGPDSPSLPGLKIRLGLRGEALQHLLQSYLDSTDAPQELGRPGLDQVLWQALLTSPTMEVVALRNSLRHPNSPTSSPVQQILDHLEGVPLPEFVHAAQPDQRLLPAYYQTSATVLAATLLKMRDGQTTTLPAWTASVPVMAPELYEEAVRPVMMQVAANRPDLAPVLAAEIRPRSLAAIARELERTGQTTQALALFQAIAAGNEPRLFLQAAIARAAALSGDHSLSRYVFSKSVANSELPPEALSALLLLSITPQQESLELAGLIKDRLPLAAILAKIGNVETASSQTWPDDLPAGEAAFTLGLKEFHRGRLASAARHFRAVTLVLAPDPDSALHQAALRFLAESTAPFPAIKPPRSEKKAITDSATSDTNSPR